MLVCARTASARAGRLHVRVVLTGAAAWGMTRRAGSILAEGVLRPWTPSPEETRLLYLAAVLLPDRNRTFTDRKGKAHDYAGVILREHLKVRFPPPPRRTRRGAPSERQRHTPARARARWCA